MCLITQPPCTDFQREQHFPTPSSIYALKSNSLCLLTWPFLSNIGSRTQIRLLEFFPRLFDVQPGFFLKKYCQITAFKVSRIILAQPQKKWSQGLTHLKECLIFLRPAEIDEVFMGACVNITLDSSNTSFFLSWHSLVYFPFFAMWLNLILIHFAFFCFYHLITKPHTYHHFYHTY